MSDSLFPDDVGKQDSPRIAWMKKHDIITWFDNGKRDGFDACPPEWFAGFRYWWPGKTGIDFFAEETGHNGDSRVGQGDTEHEALCSLLTCGEAREKGIRLWNQSEVAS